MARSKKQDNPLIFIGLGLAGLFLYNKFKQPAAAPQTTDSRTGTGNRFVGEDLRMPEAPTAGGGGVTSNYDVYEPGTGTFNSEDVKPALKAAAIQTELASANYMMMEEMEML